MQKVTRNTFEKGLNTDQELSKVQPVQYTDAQNVELVGDGDFFALKNIKGTTNVQNVITGGSVIGVFENIYDISGQKKKCLTIFTVETDYSLDASPAAFNFTGNNIAYLRGGNLTMPAASTTYTLSGQAADLNLTSCVETPGSAAYQACVGDTLYQFRYNCDGSVYQAESLGPCV